MSADNWTFCPKCRKDTENKKEKELEKLDESYGKIPSGEYILKILEAEKPIVFKETLREDYEFYMDESGLFSADYHAHCDRCGFKHEFKYEEVVKF